MATIFASSSISCCKPFNPHKNPTTLLPASISTTTFSSYLPVRLGLTLTIPNSYCNSFISNKNSSNFNKIRSVAGEESVIEQDTVTNQGDIEPTVSVPVSPSDILTMFFQAEGTMSEGAIPSVTSALEETEGISSLRVQVHEGIASVEKQTTVQATGVASNLVEIIQSSGFKLQALNLSFEDEDAN
ncbi:hypothetical protein Ccrd_012471 [Cynara cardunculus var. scolymus]|uniref:Uncharacterized protein n=1 Tax=Cynara cardunculus var. scolymus TaxID=59895 RepID=A0A103YHD0_CYNCS|nr:hypothetical protein Ccrd_012471 [Cynara cardunculus var. scolymus]